MSLPVEVVADAAFGVTASEEVKPAVLPVVAVVLLEPRPLPIV